MAFISFFSGLGGEIGSEEQIVGSWLLSQSALHGYVNACAQSTGSFQAAVLQNSVSANLYEQHKPCQQCCVDSTVNKCCFM